MRKRNARSRNNGSAAARRSNVVEIPKELAGAIKRCWPRGVVEEFATDESYFHEIHHQIERDLGSISGASLLWQTEEASGVNRDDDNPDEPPPPSFERQSYHVFFISHDGKEFGFEDETIGDDPED